MDLNDLSGGAGKVFLFLFGVGIPAIIGLGWGFDNPSPDPAQRAVGLAILAGISALIGFVAGWFAKDAWARRREVSSPR